MVYHELYACKKSLKIQEPTVKTHVKALGLYNFSGVLGGLINWGWGGVVGKKRRGGGGGGDGNISGKKMFWNDEIKRI